MKIVPLCLDSDPSLIPASCKPTSHPMSHSVSSSDYTYVKNPPSPDDDDDLDVISDSQSIPSEPAIVDADSGQEIQNPDDFNFWNERQAKRICAAVKQVFGVEVSPEVVVADANLSALARRILVSKELLGNNSTTSPAGSKGVFEERKSVG